MPSADLIAFTGLKGSGKDTAAQVFLNHPRMYVKIAFADTLRQVCALVFGLTDDEMNNPALKEVVLDRWPFMSPRQVLQKVGTELFRNNFPGVWIKSWERKVTEALAAGKRVVCTDFRFPDEGEAIATLDGIRIRIERVGQTSTDLHESERHIPNLPVETVILNDSESAQAFINKARVELAKEGLIL